MSALLAKLKREMLERAERYGLPRPTGVDVDEDELSDEESRTVLVRAYWRRPSTGWFSIHGYYDKTDNNFKRYYDEATISWEKLPKKIVAELRRLNVTLTEEPIPGKTFQLISRDVRMGQEEFAQTVLAPLLGNKRNNPSNSVNALPPGFRRAVRLFEDFHQYEPKDARPLPASVVVPEFVELVGACTYVTYRSDKWNDGTHDYVHDIESFPRVKVGKVSRGGTYRLPARISDAATLVALNKRALGFGYEEQSGELVDATARNCQWFWHPGGKALLLIQDRKRLKVVIWGGKLDWKPQGLVG